MAKLTKVAKRGQNGKKIQKNQNGRINHNGQNV